MKRLVLLLLFTTGLIAEAIDDDLPRWQTPGRTTEGRFPYDDVESVEPYVTEKHHCMLKGTLRCSGAVFYPRFTEPTEFLRAVNQAIEAHAKAKFSEWVRRTCSEELDSAPLGEEEQELAFDCREYRYKLTPVHTSGTLVSIFIETDRLSGLPHGSSSYSSLNFVWKGEQLRQVTLEDIFVCDERFFDFLSSYCLKYLQENEIGYFANTDQHLEDFRLDKNDCRCITLSATEILLTFQPYTVDGWTQGPHSIAIPRDHLSSSINRL